MEIRRATAADAATVARLNRTVQRLHAGALPHLFKEPGEAAFSAQEFAALVADEDAFVLIGCVAAEPVGYLYGQLVRRPANALRHALASGYIHHLAVEEAWRGRGCGAALVREAVARFRSEGIARIELDVWAFNAAAQRFFARQGFAVFNQRMCLETAPVGA